MTVEQNVAFGLKQDKVPKDEIAERVGKLLDLVQMRKLASRKPHQLSGGQQQRTALARSLAKRPKLLLLDEPLGALDKKLRMETQLELVNVIQSVGVTCIMVTHDQEEAMTMAHRVAVMSEGKLVQVGDPHDVYEYPNSRFTAQFIGMTNIFDCSVAEEAADHVVLKSDDLARPIYIDRGMGAMGTAHGKLWYSVRPERIGLTRERPTGDYNWFEGTVDDVAYLGTHSIYHIKLGGGRKVMAHVLSTQWGGNKPAAYGESVYLTWSNHAGVVLHA
jgi:putrescine transport system ATP-binding protein